MPAIQAHWALVAAAAEVLLEADRVAKALKKAPAAVPGMIKAYAEGDSPWCLLDTHHRTMESRWYNFEPEMGEQHDGLEKLILKAEERYTEVGSELATAVRRQVPEGQASRSRVCCGRRKFSRRK